MKKSRRGYSWLPLLALFLGVGVLGAIRESRAGGDIAWAKDYPAGLALAQKTGKPLLLSFHSPDCGWCKKMDAETFTDPQVLDLSYRFLCVRLDSELDSKIVAQYHVLDFPQTILADEHGRVLLKVPGYIPPEQFASLLRASLDALHRR